MNIILKIEIMKMDLENRNGTLSLAYGIAGFMPMFGVLFAIVSIVKGIAGLSQDVSRGLSIAGLIVAILSIIFNVLFAIFIVLPLVFVFFIFFLCCCQFGEV